MSAPLSGLACRPGAEAPRAVPARFVAGYLGVSMACLQKWRYAGVGPTWFRTSATHVVYDMDSVIETREAGGVRGVWAAIQRKRAETTGQPSPGAARMAVATHAAIEKRRAQRAQRDALDPEVLREAERIVAERRMVRGTAEEGSRGGHGLASAVD